VGYRAHLDGVRTVAVYLVVLFHADVQRFSGGFIGVDVFFVLSGYLVTQVLMRDLGSGGRVRFGRFYARRFRRLLPASALALLGTAVAYSWVVGPAELSESIEDFQAAFLYVANWFFIRESSDYFASGEAVSPVLHFWSLAVEEQFYLVWPLLLGGLVSLLTRFADRMWAIATAVVVVAAAASFGWAWHLSTVAPDRAYYGTDTRAYQLLAGALVAMTPSLVNRWRRLDSLAVPVGLMALVGLVVASTPSVPGRPVLRGMVATVFTVALIVSIERRRGPGGRFLGWKPMVELGRISYGTYLWHWPVIVILGRIGDFSPWRTALLAIAVSTGLAAISAVLVEMPFRNPSRLDQVPRLVVVGGLSTSLLLGLMVVRPLAESSGGPSRQRTITAAGSASDGVVLTPIPDDFDAVAVKEAGYSVQSGCDAVTGEGCAVVDGEGAHVLVIGDSNAIMLTEALISMAESEDLTLTLASNNGCAWQRGFFYESNPDARPMCEKIQERVYGEVLADANPDVVLAIGVLPAGTRPGPYSGKGWEQENRSATRDSVARIIESGARLVVIEPLPRAGNDPTPLGCLETASYQEQCSFTTPTDPYWIEDDLRALDAANDAMWSIDLDLAVCPDKPVCRPFIDGTFVRWDGGHTTREFGVTLADDLAAVLRDLGLTDG